MHSRIICLLICLVLTRPDLLTASEPVWPGFKASPWFEEQVAYLHLKSELRLIIVAPRPERIAAGKPNRVVLFATPNGNTIEQTLGCQKQEGRDWHFEIQQIAAQHRQWQAWNPHENLVMVCLEAKGLSWPGWRARHPDNPALIRNLLQNILAAIPLNSPRLTLACHSGGGSFLWGFLNGSDQIPDQVDRFLFLDANYSFSVADQHGRKFLDWLRGDEKRQLTVVCYDDRNVLFRGKKVIGPTGGTYRATGRMRDRFAQDLKFQESRAGDLKLETALNGRLTLVTHLNPKNQILHTTLVGEMNGYLYGMTLNTPAGEHIKLPTGPRQYTPWIQPEPFTEAVDSSD
ncbi:hypothetical protein Enr10x_47960 [Gimesia panareensis]|uniref:Alpha/beta hydrolase family protein n=1 Tax=Gimesia panareensis TaxID=2527978 RepID=A0A517QCT7_9PLAN|nr:hypothetical protein [Gimesia panareensis]QDT29442.1 hypothetical protein Enr10x_47960 [Gimesia panareensis]